MSRRFWSLLQCRQLFAGLTAVTALLVAPNAMQAATVHHTILHSFGGSNGAGPLTGVVGDGKGAFYGTTAFGGVGAGVVFKLAPGPSGYTETEPYVFKGGFDGSTPQGLTLDDAGGLYGFTFTGGNPGNGGVGWGTAFKLTPSASGFVKSTLYRFRGNPDGFEPIGAPLLGRDGTIYGVTGMGGTANFGTLFALNPGPSGYTETILHNFAGGTDGIQPEAALTMDRHGSLYGTTGFGGFVETGPCDGGCGTVFKFRHSQSGFVGKVIYRFRGADGSYPFAALTIDPKTGTIFGTTAYGGAQTDGAIFSLTPSGADYAEKLLYSFTGNADGFLPEGQLLLRSNGALDGTVTLGGGGCRGIGCGVVYELSPSASGYAFNVLYDFGFPKNGADPEWSGLVADAHGALYGTTRSGGRDAQCSDGGPGGAKGCGTVFKLER